MCEVKHTINFGQIRSEYIKTHYHVLEGESTSNLKISKLEMFKENLWIINYALAPLVSIEKPAMFPK